MSSRLDSKIGHTLHELGRADLQVRPTEFMSSGLPRTPANGFLRILGVGLLLALWVGISTLTVSPQLHHLLHQDSQSTTHHCLITQLGKETSLAGFADAIAVAPPLICLGPARLSEVHHFASFDYRLSPSRAPPSFFSSTSVAG